MNVYPALRGKFGTTDYFVVTMPVSELVSMIQFPKDSKYWDDSSLEEQFQRKLDEGRIKSKIAPYFANDSKRFSSSIVVATEGLSTDDFESLNIVLKKDLLNAYGQSSDNVGFLTIKSPKLIPLDGQHRAAAFQYVMREHNESKLGKDIISVIMINFDKTDARYIFNKINKYAKPTSKAGKLITDDDDSLAVMTRWLISECVIPHRLVNTESTSLNKKSHEFTLLSTFYEANRVLLSTLPVPIVGKPEGIEEKERGKVQKELKKEWEDLFSGIDEWKKVLKDPSEKGDESRRKLRGESVLGTPIGQLSLVKGYSHARSKKLDKNTTIKKLNKIDWSITHKDWEGLLVKSNGRMMYGARVANTASDVIAHMVGVSLSKTTNDKILDIMYGTKRNPNKRLPKRVKL